MTWIDTLFSCLVYLKSNLRRMQVTLHKGTLNKLVFRSYLRHMRKFIRAMFDISTPCSSLCRRIIFLTATKKMDEKLIIQGSHK